MRWLVSGRSRVALLGPLVMASALLACDDDPPPESRVTSVMVSGGNEQQGVVGQALAQLLSIQAVDAGGAPVRGARVTWEVVTGGGSITVGENSRTDAQGQATATWVLGNTAGQQTARAQVGTAVVQFTATAQPAAAATVDVTPEQLMLDAIGATGDLGVVARDPHGNLIEGRTPTWASSNNSIATVNATGRVTAVSRGTTTIRATLDGVTGEATAVVEPVPAAVEVSPSSPRIEALGGTVQLSARAVDRNGNEVPTPSAEFAWSSTDESIVTVDQGGLVTAVGVGTAEVEATLGDVVGRATVTVAPVAVSIVVDPDEAQLTTDEPAVQLDVEARDVNGNVIPNPTVTWTSTDQDIARVSASGLVTAVANGEAWIVARSGSARDSALITVLLNVGPLARPDSVGVEENTTRTLSAPGLLANDSLGRPPARIVSFGGLDLPGSVTRYDEGETVDFGDNGSIRIDDDGRVVFTPPVDFSGSFRTRYRLQNSAGFSDAIVTFEVGVAPVAGDDAYQTDINVQLDVASPGVLDNDDLGFPESSLTSFGGGSLGGSVETYNAGSQIAFGIGGFVRLFASGRLIFRPPNDFTGTFTFQYRLTGPAGTSDGTVTIEVIEP